MTDGPAETPNASDTTKAVGVLAETTAEETPETETPAEEPAEPETPTEEQAEEAAAPEPTLEDIEGVDETEEEEPKEPSDVPDILPTRPSFKQLEQEFPGIFKKYPDLRNMYFREKAYAEVFPSVEDARQASARMESYDGFESSIMAGDPGPLLQAISAQNSEAFKTFVGNFLPTLYKGSKEAFVTITQPIIVGMFQQAREAAAASGDKNLDLAVAHLARFVFGSPKIPDAVTTPAPQKPAPGQDPMFARVEDEFTESVHTYARRTLIKEIEQSIDPKNALTPFMKESLVKAIFSEIGNRLESDPQHMAMMNSLWSKARRAGYPREFKPRLVSAWLGRARALTPAIRRKLLAEAAGKVPPAQTLERKSIPSGGATGPAAKGPIKSVKDVKARGMDPLAFLKEGAKE